MSRTTTVTVTREPYDVQLKLLMLGNGGALRRPRAVCRIVRLAGRPGARTAANPRALCDPHCHAGHGRPDRCGQDVIDESVRGQLLQSKVHADHWH